MTKSLARKLAFVALSSMMVLGACQTGSIQTAEQKVGEGEEAYWYNPYYGADRRPANDIKMLVSILNECSPKQKLEYLEFLSKSTAKELGEFGVVYRFATKGGRQIVESDMDNFVKVLEKIDEKAQNKIFIEEVANEEKFLKRVTGNKALASRAAEIANEYRNTMAKTGMKNPKTVKVVKGLTTGVATEGGTAVYSVVDELPDLPALYRQLTKELKLDKDKVHDLMDAAYRIYQRTGTRMIKDGKEVIVDGISVISKNGCNALDNEGLETLLRQTEELENRFKGLSAKCLKDLSALRRANAIVVIEDNFNKLGRSWRASAEVAEAYELCKNGMLGISEGATSKPVQRAIAQAEAQKLNPGNAKLPATALDCE